MVHLPNWWSYCCLDNLRVYCTKFDFHGFNVEQWWGDKNFDCLKALNWHMGMFSLLVPELWRQWAGTLYCCSWNTLPMLCRWWKMGMSSLHTGSWSLSSRPQTIATNMTMLVGWWKWTETLCVHLRWAKMVLQIADSACPDLRGLGTCGNDENPHVWLPFKFPSKTCYFFCMTNFLAPSHTHVQTLPSHTCPYSWNWIWVFSSVPFLFPPHMPNPPLPPGPGNVLCWYNMETKSLVQKLK